MSSCALKFYRVILQQLLQSFLLDARSIRSGIPIYLTVLGTCKQISQQVNISPFIEYTKFHSFSFSEFFSDVFPPLGPVVHHDAEKSYDDDEDIEKRKKDRRGM